VSRVIRFESVGLSLSAWPVVLCYFLVGEVTLLKRKDSPGGHQCTELDYRLSNYAKEKLETDKLPPANTLAAPKLCSVRLVHFVFRSPTGVGGFEVSSRYPDPCQGFGGTRQISWPVSGVWRYPADILTGVRGMQESQPLSWGLQVSWPLSGVCRYPADIPISLRGLQVPGRYPDRCQGYASILGTVRGLQVPGRYSDRCRGFADTRQVSRPVAGVCRYLAGILTGVRGLQVTSRYPDQCQGFAGTRQVS